MMLWGTWFPLPIYPTTPLAYRVRERYNSGKKNPLLPISFPFFGLPPGLGFRVKTQSVTEREKEQPETLPLGGGGQPEAIV